MKPETYTLVLASNRRGSVRKITVPFYALLGVVGALIGVVESLGGKRFDVWEIPTLSRGPVGATNRRLT